MKLLFATGGTGGHINPAIAVAKHIKRVKPGAEIIFAGANTGLEHKLIGREGFELVTFDLTGFSRKKSLRAFGGNVRAAIRAAAANGKCKKLMRERQPDAVVGFGGYASFPAVYAAARLKIPTALLEVNALPGMSTRALSPFADRIMTGFEETRNRFPSAKTVFTGSPVRGDMLFADRAACKKALGMEDKPLVVSFWGSLGAYEMNRKIARFIQLETMSDDFYHIHATGSYGFEWMPGHLRELGVELSRNRNVDLREYIYDMETVMPAADLVLCRGGASTLAEICALERPSIIVPSPNVAENHQEKNARVLESEGAALVFVESGCSGDTLYRAARELLSDRKRLYAMSVSAGRLAVYDAAERIYQTILSIV